MKTSRRQPIRSLKSHMEMKAIFTEKSVLRHGIRTRLKFQVTMEMSFPDKASICFLLIIINYKAQLPINPGVKGVT